MSPPKTKTNPPPQKSTPEMSDKEIQTNYFDEWCQVTSWHCMVNVYRAGKPLKKAAWLTVILFAGFLAFYQSSVLLSDYLGDSTWMTSVSYEMPAEGSLEWPNITVCNLNRNFKSRFEADNLNDSREKAYVATMLKDAITFHEIYQKRQFSPETADLSQTISTTLSRFNQRLQNMINVTSRQMLLRYSKHCNETLIHCGKSATFLLHEPQCSCCDSISSFVWPNCFTLQPSVMFDKSYRGGDENGVYFLFDPHVNDYYDRVILNRKPSAGLKVHIHYGLFESSMPSTLLLAPGTNTLAQLVQERHRTITQKYRSLPFVPIKGNCTTNYKYRWINMEEYSKPLCYTDCWIEWSIRQANCTISTAPMKENRECIGEQMPAIFNLLETGPWNTTFDDGFNVLKCKAECGEACEYTNVEARISQAAFPAAPQVTAFTVYLNRAFPSSDRNFTDEDAKDMILFEMFFQTIEYRLVTKMEKITIGTFISNIGGALGVWTGLSMLSLFQAVVYFSEFLVASFRRMGHVAHAPPPTIASGLERVSH